MKHVSETAKANNAPILPRAVTRRYDASFARFAHERVAGARETGRTADPHAVVWKRIEPGGRLKFRLNR